MALRETQEGSDICIIRGEFVLFNSVRLYAVKYSGYTQISPVSLFLKHDVNEKPSFA